MVESGPNSQVSSAREALEALVEISKLLNTGLDPESLAICVKLCEAGVNPEALATVVQEIRREAAALQENDKYSLRWASYGLIFEDPTCWFKVSLGDRSIKASAPRTWNGLSREKRDQTNITMFKTMLKMHLFRRAYSTFL
ncbi:uncharacterized protein LOC114977316 [Acropora millepora]|uniref:uncharacterized protein LOC114977316 n=1 Tax=Acropora millepora TaxID=45264 RepID=UPI001CF1A747|nr:uncharacterized protein LOC114977316 [Acropora millepora]